MEWHAHKKPFMQPQTATPHMANYNNKNIACTFNFVSHIHTQSIYSNVTAFSFRQTLRDHEKLI